MEQGTGDKISPASLMAINLTFTELQAFKDVMLPLHPEWFNTTFTPLPFSQVVGTLKRPGDMITATVKRKAQERVEYFMDSLAKNGLPPLPGFEKLCGIHKNLSLD